jgi:beta-lactamase superfamily II metal-dependent hydrolase
MDDRSRLHLLDVGPQEYGDAILWLGGGRRMQVDGAHPQNDVASGEHPSIPEQLASLTGSPEPVLLDILVITHPHLDHIGCLPKLVEAKRIQAKWVLCIDPAIGWGRRLGEPPPDDGLDERGRALVAALREELRHDETDDAALDAFLLDALNLEQRYTKMLDQLAAGGSTVVRLGQASSTELDALVDAFAPAELQVLGPSETQLFACAEIIAERSSDSAALVADALAADTESSAASVYRRLTSDLEPLDNFTDGVRPGAAINLQSIVLSVGPQDQRVLLTGDMQFARPQVSDATVRAEVKLLRQRVRDAGPYRMVKIAHHGSSDSFSKEVIEDTGDATMFGICAGAGSRHHPDPTVLGALSERPGARWARTDRNGLSSFDLRPDSADPITLARGQLNDVTAPGATPPVPPGPPGPPTVEWPGGPVTITGPAEHTLVEGAVELVARLPARPIRVRLSVDIEEQAEWRPDEEERGRPTVAGTGPLLFITDRQALSRNVGAREAVEVLRALEERGARIENVPHATASRPELAALVVDLLARHDELEGVVLIGGYEVVPSVRLDALPPSIRAHVANHRDPDDFIVWSDDAYGDRDGDGLPELPVTRVPDGRSAELLRAQLTPAAHGTSDRAGIRNVRRPFAEGVFADLSGSNELLVSSPLTYDAHPGAALTGQHIYLMLHGDYVDASRFWGEGTPGDSEAMNAENIPDVPGAVVLAGCCWGALITQTPASRVAQGRPVAPRTPEASIALTFLRRGARAFVGCTGAHYSPSVEPYDYYGGPLHRAFWIRIGAGTSPARALFEAKVEYLKGIPHGQGTWNGQAIEYKIWRQFTCLGPAWTMPQ